MREQPSFSTTVLQRLQTHHYRPNAWMQLLISSWEQARTTADQHPQLVRDWQRLSATSGALTLGFIGYTTWRHGRTTSWRCLLSLTVLALAQRGDQYVHLGLHRYAPGHVVHQRLGPANVLTMLRCWVGLATLSRLLAGTPLTDDELLVALATTLVSDLSDGWLARHRHFTSALGAYLDVEADLVSWTALTVTQVWRGQLPVWFLAVYALRWGGPLAVGLSRTFARATPLPFHGSWVGRAAAASQVLLTISAVCASLRSQQSDAQRWRRSRAVFLTSTCLLFGATMLKHVAYIARVW